MRHGEIVEPKDRFVTYGLEQDVSDELMRYEGDRRVVKMLEANAVARAKAAAAEIDPDAPIIVTIKSTEEQKSPRIGVRRWRIYVQVEFWRYVYDATKRMAQEWERTKHLYT